MTLYVAKCNLGEVKIEAMQAAVFFTAAQTCCPVSGRVLGIYRAQVSETHCAIIRVAFAKPSYRSARF